MTSILLVDDQADAVLSLSRAIKAKENKLTVDAASQAGKAREMLSSRIYHAVVLDLSLDAKLGIESGFTLLQDILSDHPETKIIVLTGHSSTENGVRALRMGAAHFLEKPPDISHLLALIKDCVSQSELFRAYKSSCEGASGLLIGKALAGGSPAIQQLREELKFVATTNQAVLLLGETGTGKTLCANLIHTLSQRAKKRFIIYTPAYLNSDLLNSELYGHLKGAFTGANENRTGLLSEADGGTFFIDEIDEIPHDLQVSLLKVLQGRTFRVLGSNREEFSDFRLISASNRKEDELTSAGKLREDFFHRIAHKIIRIPALRERPEDIADLSQNILERLDLRENLRIHSLEPAALDRLIAYKWPGNIRELEAVLSGAAYLSRYRGRTVIQEQDLGFETSASEQSSELTFHQLVEDYKFKLVEDALTKTGNNQVQAARLLGLDRSSLRRILGNKSS